MTSPDSHPAHSSLEALAESAPDAILTIDTDSTIISANPATERVFGYEPEELVGQKLTILIPERLRASHRHGIARYVSTGRRNIAWTGVELMGLRKDGQEIPVEIAFGEFVDESGRRLFSGFVRDVSERVRQKKEIQNARADAERALSDLAKVGHIIDTPLSKGSYDKMLDDLLVRLREEVKGDSAAVLLLDENLGDLAVRASVGLDLKRVTARVRLGQGVSGVAASGEPMIIDDTSETQAVSRALGSQMASIAAVPIKSDDDVIGVLLVGSGTPHRINAGDLRLLQLVAERTGGVFARARLYTEVQAAVSARDEVLSVVSHDLRNPVSTIAMSASLLSDPEGQLTDEERREQVGVIARSADRMNRLIQDLLDVARIESGRLTVSCRCEDAGQLAAEACEAFRPIAADKELDLDCDIEKSLRPAYADRDRVLQLLSNYLNNAVKFTAKRGRIVVRVRHTESGGVRYSVTDNGPGIPPEELPHVFNRFWQSKHTAHLGSGLGLAIALGVAQAHHGRVWVESAPGVETTFYFELPHSKECG